MDQPPCFIVPGNSKLCCHFHYSFHGLKQSPRAWFGRFSFSLLIQFGMTRCEAVHYVFFLHSSTGRHMFLVVCVDDILIIGDDEKVSNKLNPIFSKAFRQKTWVHSDTS
jgi:hypothetical protein